MAYENEMAFDDIYITQEICPLLIFHGKDRDNGHHENLVLNYSQLLNQIHCLWLLNNTENHNHN